MILRRSGKRESGDLEKYLGLPTMVGRSKYNSFRGVKERIWSRIQNWKNIFLSQAGKEVLIKAVLQSIPTYVMSVFKLPKRLCTEISSLLSKFWWNNMDKEKIHWKRWKKVGKQRALEVLDSMTLPVLIKLCCQNRCGDSYLILSL